jgi:hypothetical protein
MKDAENAKEEKKEAPSAEETKNAMKDAENAKEEKKEAPSADDGEKKTEEDGQGTDLAHSVTALASENNADGKTAETEVAPPTPVEEEKKKEESQAAGSVVPPPASLEGEKKVDGAATDLTAPPVAETKADAPPAEAAKGTENSEQVNAGPQETSAMNKGQIQPDASTVRCT